MIIKQPKKVEIKIEEKRDIYKEPGEINRFGIKILYNGEQWIIDAKTGFPERRDNYDCMEGQRGFYIWVKKGDSVRPLDTIYASIWDVNQKELR